MTKTNDYWLNRWAKGETKWHQAEFEPALVKWLSGREKRRVLVPLCGKSLDMKWLLGQGHEVIGCEISQKACEAFLREHDVEHTTDREGKFTVYRGKNLTLFNGDIFDLKPEHVGTLGAIYDRAALIALDRPTRRRYADLLASLVPATTVQGSFEWLEVVVVRTPLDELGPPYSVTPEEVEMLYSPRFQSKLLSREVVESMSPDGNQLEECVLLLVPSAGSNPTR